MHCHLLWLLSQVFPWFPSQLSGSKVCIITISHDTFMCLRYWANQCIPIKYDLSKLNNYRTYKDLQSVGSHCSTHHQWRGPHCYPAVSNPVPTFHFRIRFLGSLLVSTVLGWITQDIDFRTLRFACERYWGTLSEATPGGGVRTGNWDWTMKLNFTIQFQWSTQWIL